MKKNYSLLVLLTVVLFAFSCGNNKTGENNSTESKYKIEISKTVFSPGEKIEVNFTADPNWDPSAWIGIIPSETPHGKESVNDDVDVDYRHLDGKEKGKIELYAPDKKGKWDLRMNDDDNGDVGKEIFSLSFEVK